MRMRCSLLVGLPLSLLLLGLTGGCDTLHDRADYQRHTMSDLREDWRRPGVLLFEADASSLYPADSAEAEAVRMEWLAAWMKRSGFCPSGWTVLSRTEIDPSEVHARRHDLRYEVECNPMSDAPAD